MIHRGNSQIQIMTVENGFIVILPTTYKPPKVKHRLRVDHSDPVLENLKEDEPEEEVKPEPFQFQIGIGVHVFPNYEQVLAFLTGLKDSKRTYPGGPEAQFAAEAYFE